MRYCDIGFAKVDTDRCMRRGYPEVIYCPGKTRQQIKSIAKELLKKDKQVLLTKVTSGIYSDLRRAIPKLKYNKLGQVAFVEKSKKITKKGTVLVITGGTSDIPVAEEAIATLEFTGNKCKRLYDVGVAGVHRLLDNDNSLRMASVIIVIAGMEGALASLVSGLVACPVIAVPTSCGYGASFKGLSALLTMMNSCSPGVAVVNIDNGFGAGYFANLINR
ncbi:MAG TPA: nickel pincer cofactor biosynthesis protein LarB [Candidatus Omnitrophota bacterium]|nr:nickel pincer cofactor biosynthesis protein LarB [Candidatus Omnitrophota bacterium]